MDLRGNSSDRRSRRLWILENFGNGEETRCWWCSGVLDYKSLEVDRWPVCGHDGGRYHRDNIVPACLKCNHGRCSDCKAGRPWTRPDWWSAEGRRGITLRTAMRRAG